MLTPRASVAITFLCFGIGLGLWSGSVPEVSLHAGLSPEALGAAFVGFGIAGIAGFAVAGRVLVKISLKRRLLLLLALTALCLSVLLHAHSPFMLFAALFIYSFLAASVDLVMNSEGVAVERDTGFPILSGFHAMSSVGLAGGAILGSYLSVTFGVTITAIAGFIAYGTAMFAVFKATPDRGPTEAASGQSWFKPSTTFILLATIVGISIAVEISAIMFSAKTLAAEAPTLIAYAGSGATVYAVIQAVTRFGGDALRAKIGDEKLLVISLGIILIGLANVVLSTGFTHSIIGFGIIGLGTACIVPAGFALAPKLAPASAAAAISTLSMIGAPFRIFAPLVYGGISGAAGFSYGYGIYAALAVIAFFLALLMVQRTTSEVTP
jgi:predicted MFS family arabinose efflux permease